jgi:hypothetical protein
VTVPPRARSRRLRREAQTVEIMVRMYCRHNHEAGTDLCPDCAALLDYSLARVDVCRFGAAKPTCARCSVHCFRPAMREHIKIAMRYSGPRMTYRHPYLALCHIADRRRGPR